jgi:hypothetical protein
MSKKEEYKPQLMPLYLSDSFRKILEDILKMSVSPIAKKLLHYDGNEEYKFPITYIDNIDGDDTNVSFAQVSRIKRMEERGEDISDTWNMRGRVTGISIGRLIRRLFGDKVKETSIEKFVNKYKATIRRYTQFENLEMVSGDDIKYWYHQNKYYTLRSTLGGSCMQYSECQSYFGIYTKNPNQVRLCILKTDDGNKIKGRALVSNLTEPDGLTFMDRIYTNDDADVNLFKEYAKLNGWAIKKKQSYTSDDIVMPNGDIVENPKLIVELDNVDFNRYPYMDTLRFFYRSEEMLSNQIIDDFDFITLNDTSGYYNEWDGDYEPTFVTDWRGNEINEEDAVWCDIEQIYCLRSEAIRVTKGENGRGKYFTPDAVKNGLLKYSAYTDSYYHKDDVVYSKRMKDWIYKKYAVKVYYDKNKTKWEWTHRLTLHDDIGKIGDDYYVNEILYRDITVDENGKEILGDYHFLKDYDNNKEKDNDRNEDGDNGDENGIDEKEDQQ